MECKNCFHLAVCERALKITADECEFYADIETTITIPTVSDDDIYKVQKKVKSGYAFVNAALIDRLVKESGDLAKLRIKLARLRGK